MLRKLLLLIVISFTIISCQKDFTMEDTDPPVLPPISDSTLLESYIELDTTLATGMDTVLAYRYSYDAQKRISSISIREGYDGTNTASVIVKQTYHYTGSDSFPTRIISVTDVDYGPTMGGLFTHLDTIHFFYNASGKRIKDSITSFDVVAGDYFVDIYRYNYGSGQVIQNNQTTYISGPSAPFFEELIDTFYTNTVNGNLLSQVDTAYDDFGEFSYEEKHSLTYDDKINPFSTALKMFNLSPVLSIEMSNWQITQKSNPLQLSSIITYADGSKDRFGRRYAYLYKANNLPLSVIIKDYDPLSGADNYIAKGFFKYTR